MDIQVIFYYNKLVAVHIFAQPRACSGWLDRGLLNQLSSPGPLGKGNLLRHIFLQQNFVLSHWPYILTSWRKDAVLVSLLSNNEIPEIIIKRKGLF